MVNPEKTVRSRYIVVRFVIASVGCSRLAALSPPLGRAESGQRLKLSVAELDMGGADHARLEPQGISDVAVDLCGGVVAHDEVVAVGVLHLVDGDGLGEGEDAPVREAADDAAVLEYEGADGVCDPARASGQYRHMEEARCRRRGKLRGGGCRRGAGGTYSFTSERLPGRTWFALSARSATKKALADGSLMATAYNCDEFVEHLGDGIYDGEG